MLQRFLATFYLNKKSSNFAINLITSISKCIFLCVRRFLKSDNILFKKCLVKTYFFWTQVKKGDCGGKNYFFICFQNLLWNIEVQKCGENVVFQLQKIARSQIDTHFLRQFFFKKWIFFGTMGIFGISLV